MMVEEDTEPGSKAIGEDPSGLWTAIGGMADGNQMFFTWSEERLLNKVLGI